MLILPLLLVTGAAAAPGPCHISGNSCTCAGADLSKLPPIVDPATADGFQISLCSPIEPRKLPAECKQKVEGNQFKPTAVTYTTPGDSADCHTLGDSGTVTGEQSTDGDGVILHFTHKGGAAFGYDLTLTQGADPLPANATSNAEKTVFSATWAALSAKPDP